MCLRLCVCIYAIQPRVDRLLCAVFTTKIVGAQIEIPGNFASSSREKKKSDTDTDDNDNDNNKHTNKQIKRTEKKGTRCFRKERKKEIKPLKIFWTTCHTKEIFITDHYRILVACIYAKLYSTDTIIEISSLITYYRLIFKSSKSDSGKKERESLRERE